MLQMISIQTEHFEGLAGNIVRMELIFEVAEVEQTLFLDDIRMVERIFHEY